MSAIYIKRFISSKLAIQINIYNDISGECFKTKYPVSKWKGYTFNWLWFGITIDVATV